MNINLQIPECLVDFPISLEDLFLDHIVHALPSYKNIVYWHNLLMEYVNDGNAPLLIRKQTIDKKDCRGKIIAGKSSNVEMLFADNGPAWAVLKYCFYGNRPSLSEWKDMVSNLDIPCHRNDISKKINNDHHNARGWHIAHIEKINDGSNPHLWNKSEIRQKCLKFLHPLNYFPFPLDVWRQYGGNLTILSYIKKHYNSKYCEIRKELLEHIAIEEPYLQIDSITEEERSFMISNHQIENNIPENEKANVTIINIEELKSLHFDKEPKNIKLSDGRTAVCWSYSRLIFYRDPIEKLRNLNDIILINIVPSEKSGVHYDPALILISKNDFYKDFGNITKTKSYQDSGKYHYSRPPENIRKYYL